jgi:dynamin 1-like protein
MFFFSAPRVFSFRVRKEKADFPFLVDCQAPSLEYPGESSGLTQREEMETNLIRALIASYFSIVRQTVKDLVPKAIMRETSPFFPFYSSMRTDTRFDFPLVVDLLVNFSRESVQNRLVASLYKDSLFGELLYEDEALTAERTRIKGLLKAYKEAFQVRLTLSLF